MPTRNLTVKPKGKGKTPSGWTLAEKGGNEGPQEITFGGAEFGVAVKEAMRAARSRATNGYTVHIRIYENAGPKGGPVLTEWGVLTPREGRYRMHHVLTQAMIKRMSKAEMAEWKKRATQGSDVRVLQSKRKRAA